MEDNILQSPTSKMNKKYLVFSLPVIGILLILFGIWIDRVFLSNNQNSKLEQTKTGQPVSTSAVKPTQSVTKVPIPKTSIQDEIIKSAFLNENCKITVTSDVKKYEVPTGLAGGMDFKCAPSSIGKISPSGKFLAYEDVSGGIDSVMALFSIDYGKPVTLGVWGTSSIMDFMFLSDDKFVAINGYPDIFNEQWLTLFDLPKIFSDFSNNFNEEYFYFVSSNPTYESTIHLPNVGETHKKLSFTDSKVQTKSDNGDLLVQYDLEEIVMNSTNYSITPRTALTLVYYADKENVDSVNGPITKQILDSENSTNDFWAVDVVNTKTNTTLRSYMVDQKSGEVISNN